VISSIAVINPEMPAPMTAVDGWVEGSIKILKDFVAKKAAPYSCETDAAPYP